MIRTLAIAASLLAALLVLASCNHTDADAQRPDITSMSTYVLMRTTAGDIVLELDPVRAPISTANFLDHAKAGHYDGTIFHRVIPEFVIQGGGWTPDLKERAKADAAAGHADKTIRNEWQNGLKNERGTIAMAREEQPDTATREFYINVRDNFKLDTARPQTGSAGYAVFGKVVSGWEAIETIRTGKTSSRPDVKVDDGSMNDVPVVPVQITRVVKLSIEEARARGVAK